jgi:RimJ/RimL family protein N-acetyltransferase
VTSPRNAGSEQSVGPPVEVGVAARPEAIAFEGRYCLVEALNPRFHGAALWRAFGGDDSLWTYMGYGPFGDEEPFRLWLDERAALSDPLSYVIVDRGHSEAAGLVTLMEVRPEMRVIEIGNIVYGPSLQRSRAATEAQYLMARYVFETLGYRRYEWKCNALNMPSRRAALRLGFIFEGVFRQHMIVKGRNRDTAWYAMLDDEWPARKANFERWLVPENFDSGGRQIVSLSVLNTAGASAGRPRL